jgi:nucleoid-associated protein YgaU
MRAAIVTTLCVLSALTVWSALRESERAATEAVSAAPSADVASGPLDAAYVPATSRTHVVIAGDTLPALAVRYYGDARRAGEILAANRERIADPAQLPVGAALVIP